MIKKEAKKFLLTVECTVTLLWEWMKTGLFL